MKQALIFGQHGTPLHIFSTESFTSWSQSQSPFIQNWLKATDFKGQGLALVPATSGELEQVVYFADDLTSYWLCGDLVNQLPVGTYQLMNDDAALRKQIAFSWALGHYSFDTYKSLTKDKAQLVLNNQHEVTEFNHLVKGIAIVRDLVNTPAADMMPQHLAEIMQDLAEQFSGQFSEVVGDELLEQNYPTIHMVGRASENKPRLLELKWGQTDAPKVTLVGKGVCFDSGGLDLKPGAGMRYMKKDMGGAAHVIGLAYLVMAFKLPVSLRVLVPAVENAVSNNAFRPGDVIQTRSGKTVEIDNTDAEGRLVLCDALTEAQAQTPEIIIDFATLTGACRIALGTELPGFFTDDRDLAAGLLASGLEVDDPVWHMPLHKPYKDYLKSDVADLSNCAQTPFGGAITAALYLQEFVAPSTPWVHFDIMAWNNRKLAGRPVGGEAFGVRAVFEYLSKRYQ